MAVTTDIARTWRRPGAVMRDHLAAGRREDRALAFLMIGCFMMFVARWPVAARRAEAGEGEVAQLMAYDLFGTMILLPLLLYALAFLVWALARPFLPALAPWQARLALFWAWLAAAPVALLHGLTQALGGDPRQGMAVGAVWLGVVLWFTIAGLRTAGARHA